MYNPYYDGSAELYHYGIKGMKWGVRRTPEQLGHVSGVRSALARRSNKKVDQSFKDWKENDAKKQNAIDLGKQANEKRMAYERDPSNKQAKAEYKEANKAYKKALKENTTYRKGVIKKEVGQDVSRKLLSEAKKVKKQLDSDPSNKELAKKYQKLMDAHDIERARARRAVDVATNRSRKIANMKRTVTMTVKSAATTAAVGLGLAAVNKYVLKNDTNITADQVLDWAKKGRTIMSFLYL